MDTRSFLRQLNAIICRATDFKKAGRKVVVVQGLGFVGCAVSAAIAGARGTDQRPLYFVIGVDLRTEEGIAKINAINAGLSPVDSPDLKLSELIKRGARENNNLCCTFYDEAYALADILVVNIPLDVKDRTQTEAAKIEVDTGSFRAAVARIGHLVNPEALIVVETTVPIGASRHLILPVLREEFAKRGFYKEPQLAYSYERVMPGPHYVDSITRFWRSFSANSAEAALKAREFLSTFIETKEFPLCELESLEGCELGKLLENSYRSANIALIYEWTLLAERIGVDLFSVIDSIRVRRGTHCNMRFPGFGVGGYCLTKDSLLAQWSLTNLFDADITLGMTLEAIGVNYRMPMHTLELAQEIIGGSLEGVRVLICGLSYLPGVPDTRNSPGELLYDELVKAGAQVTLHDPIARAWPQRPHAKLLGNLTDCLGAAQLIIFTTAHGQYLDLDVQKLAGSRPSPPFIVDAQNVICNSRAEQLHGLGCALIGVGKGHWRARGYHKRVQTWPGS
ncbi:MAG: nucleotide sugar dehydrogenase [Syntrophobacteraceae bacterium]